MSLSNWLARSSLVAVALTSYWEIANSQCTTGGTSVAFPSSTLTSVASCDDNYDDPNDMGFNLFSISGSGSSTYVSDNFQVSEFGCLDGDDYFRLSVGLVNCLQAVREDIATALYIKEAYRTVSYNTEVDGATYSRHMSGTAATIYSTSLDVLELADSVICTCIDMFDSYGYSIGLGLGDDYVHVDLRSSDAYWVETGSSYTSTEWSNYITTSYSSCSSGGGGSTGGGTDSGDNTNDDGTIRFPNANLSPVYYTSWIYNDPNGAGANIFSVNDAGRYTYLSDNFMVDEFACNDGSDGFRLIPELVECLQAVRDDLGFTINVNSGYRTVSYNSQVGGASYSRHMSGTGADIQQYSTDIYTFADSVICKCRSIFIAAGQEVGLGLGASYLHVDMRPYHSYWTYSGAGLSQSNWGSYISSTYSSCPSVSGFIVEGTNKTYAEIAEENESIAANDDINDDTIRDDIDEEEVLEDADNDSSSGGNGSGYNGVFSTWWGILIIVACAIVILGAIGYCAYSKCKVYMEEKNTYNQYSSGYTKVDE